MSSSRQGAESEWLWQVKGTRIYLSLILLLTQGLPLRSMRQTNTATNLAKGEKT